MRLWIHLTAATLLTVCDFTNCDISENPSNENDSKSKETSSEDHAVSSSSKVDEFMITVPTNFTKHFISIGRKVAFQPKQPSCMKALKWLQETYKKNITVIEKLIIYNTVSCPPKSTSKSKAKFCGRNEIGHTRFFKNKCLQCAKGCKDVLLGGTRYVSRGITDCNNAGKECNKISCLINEKCVYKESGYRCHCPIGYEGHNCTPVTDECSSFPCQNGGTCFDKVNAYNCSCASGFEGSNCEKDIDECMSSPCQNGATCFDEVNGYNCSCEPGYNGIHCEYETDECLSSPCQNGATCVDKVNDYNCSCAPGYEGINCENDTDECNNSPCQHGGTCLDMVNGYSCSCAPGYEGINCDNDTDECNSSPCQNGGTCLDMVNGYSCSCATGYQGINCENDIPSTVMKAQEIVHCVRTSSNDAESWKRNCTICSPSDTLEGYQNSTIPILPEFCTKNST